MANMPVAGGSWPAVVLGRVSKQTGTPPAQAQRRGTAPPMVATRARSPGAAGRPGPPPVAPVWVLAVSRRSSLKQMEASLTYF